MALTTPTSSAPVSFPAARGRRHEAAGPSVAGRQATGVLRLRRGVLLRIAMMFPLLLAFVGFAVRQFSPAALPAPPAEAVVRGKILAADGTILAGGPVDSRTYPYGDMAAALLGFTGAVQPDGRFGLEGLEFALDPRLSAGQDVVLTLDPTIQAATDRHLAASAVENGAQSGAAVVLEAGTGRILAASSYPTYDVNEWRSADADARINRPFLQEYEPGSVIKPLVVAGLLESGRLKPTEMIDSPMTLRVGAQTFRDVARHDPVLSVPDVLAFSSNSGMIHLGERFAPAELHDWLMRFGIGQDLDLTTTYTRSGILNPWYRWVPQDQASNTIGQNHSTTALQLAAAYSIFANDGVYVPPRLTAEEQLPEPHRVLSPEVAQAIRSMLTHVTDSSGLHVAAVPGLDVAAKTGTADMFDPELNRYVPGDYSLSVAGMFPAAKPKVVLVVVLHKPEEGTTSTYTTGSLFRAISGEIVASWDTAPRAEAYAGGN